jgi:hypothetical protein
VNGGLPECRNAESVNRGAIHDDGVGDIEDTVINHNSGTDEEEVPPRRQVAMDKIQPWKRRVSASLEPVSSQPL